MRIPEKEYTGSLYQTGGFLRIENINGQPPTNGQSPKDGQSFGNRKDNEEK